MASIQSGRAAVQRGDFDAARASLVGIDHPEALYLLAHALLHGHDLDAAEDSLRRALKLQPNFRPAAESLGRLMIDLQRWDDASSVYEKLLQTTPGSLAGRYGLATAQLNRGQGEAAEQTFDRLIREGNDRPEIRFMRGRARLEVGRIEAGLRDLENSYARRPEVHSLKALAGALWMQDDREAFDALVAGALKRRELCAMAAELVRESGHPERAIESIEAVTGFEQLHDASFVLTQAYIDLDDAPAAERAARAGLEADAGHSGLMANLVSALLMQGKANEALATVMPLRRSEPDRQHWIAYEATALRLLGDARYETLVDMDRFVRAYELQPPPGFDSISAFNAALLAALEPLHQHQQHPLDQSLRHGSQTSRDLTGVDDPVIRQYVRALDGPIRDYMHAVGAGEDHPLTARNTGNYRIAGSWSVRLHGRGWHVNHVHPEGWLSSAYYVSVPDDVEQEASKAGWIKFGEPPFATRPPTPPQRWIKPAAGLVVLFPSFLWHGTAAIGADSVRVTAPFDVVPV